MDFLSQPHTHDRFLYSCEDGIAKICPSGSLSSFGMPGDANWWSSGWIFLSYPHTHVRFLYSCEDGIAKICHSRSLFVITWHASWCQSAILGIDFFIPTSHSWYILIFLWGWDSKNLSLGITACHHLANLVVPNGEPRDRFFYPTLTLMMDSYCLWGSPFVITWQALWCQAVILGDRSFYPTLTLMIDSYILREKSLAIYFEDSQFWRNRTFNFIVSKI